MSTTCSRMITNQRNNTVLTKVRRQRRKALPVHTPKFNLIEIHIQFLCQSPQQGIQSAMGKAVRFLLLQPAFLDIHISLCCMSIFSVNTSIMKLFTTNLTFTINAITNNFNMIEEYNCGIIYIGNQSWYYTNIQNNQSSLQTYRNFTV